MTTPAIPAWQLTDLENLSSSGQLYGLSPTVVGSIDQAESSGSGGGINSSGYGGWFGLGENSTYPGGTVSPALLESTSETSFIAQAKIAASEFASLLTKYGNPTSAEEAYQSGTPSGPTEGSNILDANLGTNPALTGPAGTNQATLTSLNANPFDLFGIPGTVAGGAAGSAGSAVADGLGTVIATVTAPLKQWVEDAGLIIFGIVIIVVGLVVIAHASVGAVTGANAREKQTREAARTTQQNYKRYGGGGGKKNSSGSSEDKGAAADAAKGVESGEEVAATAAAA
jgi:hypothetical protein